MHLNITVKPAGNGLQRWGEAILAKHISPRRNNALRKIRMERNMSQSELERLSGVHWNTIYRIETGTISPNVDTALKLCKALNCSLDDIFGEKAQTETENE